MHLPDVCCFLLPGCIDDRLRLFALALVFRVRDETDNFDFALLVVEGDSLTEDFFIRKVLALKGLVDDGYERCVLIVLCVELASAQEGNFHRRKIILPHHLPHRLMLRCGRYRFAWQ